MWTLALIHIAVALTAVAAAPVNLPQTISCPDDKIYVYVNDSAHDRKPYIFVELYADGLQDCIRKCFGNQFCYSLKYDVDAVEQCSLYYFAAYNCTGKDLVLANSVQYPGKGATTIDCLRCPANGDFVTAPPFDTFTDQSIVAKDSEGKTIFSKPLIKEVTDNIESKLTGEDPSSSLPSSSAPTSVEEEGVEADTTTESTVTGPPTSESRVTVPKRACPGSLKFLYTTEIDRETVELLLNETTVTSGDECAQLCFDLKCGFAFYKPTDKSCRFSTNTEDIVDHSTCEVSSEHYKSTIPEEEAVQITCVSCVDQSTTQRTAIDPEKVDSKPQTEFAVDSPVSVNKQPDLAAPLPSTLYPACIINFQLDEDADTLNFKHYEVEKVKSVNDCARICFRGRCAAAVYSPRRGECLLGADYRDTCSNAAATIRYVKQDDVKIQCFRCSSPKHFEAELAQASGTTPVTPEISHQEDREHSIAQEDQAQPPKTSSDSTTTSETMSTTASLAIETTGKVESTAATPEISHQEDREHSIAQEDQAQPPKTSSDSTTTSEMTSTTASLAVETTGKVESTVAVRKNCLIKFQARPFSERPAEFTAPFELEVPADSAELCATRCYQDGCSGAKYDPKAGSCALSYNDKQFCARGGVVLHYKADNVTWIHCVNCYTLKDSDKDTSAASGTVASAISSTASASRTVTPTAAAEAETTTSSVEETTAAASVSISETTTSAAPEQTAETSTSTTSEATSTVTKSLLEAGSSTSKATSSDEFQRGCLIKFQAAPFEQRPKEFTAPFELVLPVDSIELCATRCYQDGCSAAKYEPTEKSCSLSYNDKPFCSRGPVILHYEAKNTTWIHCVNCYRFKDSEVSEFAQQKEGEVEQEVGAETTPTAITTTSAGSLTTSVPREIGEPVVVLPNRTRGENAPHFQKGCAIKFQARPFSERPPEFQAKFELELPVDTVEMCATRCYQDGCSGAKFDPKAHSCALSYNDKHFCTNSGVVLQYDATELTWIHCVNCYTLKPQGGKETPTKGGTESAETTTKATTGAIDETTTSEHSSSPSPVVNETAIPEEGLQDILQKGCIVNFQIVEFEERPTQFTSAFETPFSTDTAEICAHRCYQDGCTGAKFDPKSKMCSLSYNDRPMCSSEKLVQVARPEQEVFMHCLSCAPHKAGSKLEVGSGANGEKDVHVAPETITSQPSELIPSTTTATILSSSEMSSTAPETSGEVPEEQESPSVTTSTLAGESTGVEPVESNKVPHFEANEDEEVGTVTASSATVETTTTSTLASLAAIEPVPSTSPVSLSPKDKGSETSSTTSEAGPLITEASGETATEEAHVTISMSSTPSEASGEEAAERSESNVGANEDKEATTTTASITSTSAESSGEVPVTGNKVPNVETNADGDTTATETHEPLSTTQSGTGETAVPSTTLIPVVLMSGASASIAGDEHSTTAGPAEAGGEEPSIANKVPNVAANVDEETTTAAKFGNGETAAPSTTLVPVVLVSGASASTAAAGDEHLTTAGPIEASGEEPSIVNKVPNVAANVDEETTTAATEAHEPVSTTQSGTEETAAPSTTLVPVVLVSGVSASTAVASNEHSTTAGPIEASGEEPAIVNKVPSVAANVDEETTTAATEAHEPVSTTQSGTEETAAPSTTLVPVVLVSGVGASTAVASNEHSTTAGPIEASGEEPSIVNKVPNVAANVDEETTTAATGEHKSVSTTQSATGETAPSTTLVPVVLVSGPSVSTAAAGDEHSTTAGPIEASGKEPAIVNKVPSVAANVDEETTTAATEAHEPVSTTQSGTEETAAPSTTLVPVVLVSGVSASTAVASNEHSTTAGPIEASGEEPSIVNKVPNVAANVDEETTTAATGEHKSVSTTQSATGETAPSTTLVPVVLVSGPSVSTAAAGDEHSTTAGPIEASGEEPAIVNKVPSVAANVDEETTTAATEAHEPVSTTQSGTEETAAPSTTLVPVVLVSGVSASTAVASDEHSTTAGPIEASGEEPAIVNKVPSVAANVDEETTTAATETHEPVSTTQSGTEETAAPSTTLVPVVLVGGVSASTAAAGDEHSTTAGPIEASGEESAIVNKVPSVAANVDEETTTAATEAHEPVSTTQSGTEETVAPSTTLVPVVLVGGVSASTAAAGDEHSTTAGPIEASGEEPAIVNKVPNVAANVDEETTTAATEAHEPVSTTQSGTEETAAPSTTLVPVVLVGAVSASTAVASNEHSTTAGPIEASGEEPAIVNKVPSVAANVDEETTTAATEAHEPVSTTQSGTEETAAPSTTLVPVVLVGGVSASTAAAGDEHSTTAGPIEASGEESAIVNKVPSVAANVDEETTTAATEAHEPVSTTQSGTEETVAPSTTLVPVVLVGGVSASTAAAGDEHSTTAGPTEASGEEPAIVNKVPNVAANVDEETTTVATEAHEPVSTTQSGTEETAAPSTTLVPVVLVGAVSASTAAAGDEHSTTAGPTEASGEPAIVNKVPNVAANVDEETTTAATQEHESVFTTQFGTGETAAPSTKLVPVVLVGGVSASTAVASDEHSTTAGPTEASGEEPAIVNKVPNVAANVDEETTTVATEAHEPVSTTQSGTEETAAPSTTLVPVVLVGGVSASTAAAGDEHSTTAGPTEASGEEPAIVNKVPNVAANVDEETTTVATEAHEPVSTTQSGTEETAAPSTTLVPVVLVGAVSASTAAAGDEHTTTAGPTEASGEEPAIVNKVPNVAANVDEETTTAATQEHESVLTTQFGTGETAAPSTKLVPVVLVGGVSASTAVASDEHSTTAGPTEASGEEPAIVNKVPNVAANVDEETTTVATEAHEPVSTTQSGTEETAAPSTTLVPVVVVGGVSASTAAAGDEHSTTAGPTEASGEVQAIVNKVPNVAANVDEETTTAATEAHEPVSTTQSGTEESAAPSTRLVPVVLVSGVSASTAVAGDEHSTTAGPTEASGEEPAIVNKVPNVAANVDEETTTAATEAHEPVSTTQSGTEETAAPSTTLVPVVLVGAVSASTAAAGDEHSTTAGPTEASGEEPAIVNKVPNVAANVDEETTTVATEAHEPVSTTQSGTEETAAPSTTLVPVVLVGAVSASTAAAGDEHSTTAGPIEASGEESAIVSKVPNVAANVDEETTTAATEAHEPVSTIQSGTEETAAPSTTLVPVVLVSGVSASTAVASDEHSTTAGPIEASGEEPAIVNKVPNVAANVDEETTTAATQEHESVFTTQSGTGETAAPSTKLVPVVLVGEVSASTAAAGDEHSTTAGPIEASGEEPAIVNKVPNVAANVDEETTTAATEAHEPVSTTQSGTEETAAPSTTLVPVVLVGGVSASTAAAGDEHSTTAGPIEASGEEPAIVNKVPNVAANVDEETTTAATEAHEPVSTTQSETEETAAPSTTLVPVVLVSGVSASTAVAGDEHSTTPAAIILVTGSATFSSTSEPASFVIGGDEEASATEGESRDSTAMTANVEGDLNKETSTVTVTILSHDGSHKEKADETPTTVYSVTNAPPSTDDKIIASTMPSNSEVGSEFSAKSEDGTTTSFATTEGSGEHDNKLPEVQTNIDDTKIVAVIPVATTTNVSVLATSSSTLTSDVNQFDNASSTPIPRSFVTEIDHETAAEGHLIQTTMITPTKEEGNEEEQAESSVAPNVESSADGRKTTMDTQSASTISPSEQTTEAPAISGSGSDTSTVAVLLAKPIDSSITSTPASPVQESMVTAHETSTDQQLGSSKAPNSEANLDEKSSDATTPLNISIITPAPTLVIVVAEGFLTSTTSALPSDMKSASPSESEGSEPTSVETLEASTVITVESSGEEALTNNTVPIVEAVMDERTTVTVNDGRKTSGSLAFVTSAPDETRSSLLFGSESSTDSPLGVSNSNTPSANATKLEDDEEEDSIINPSILERPHNANLPVNVGFVPGSEPDTLHTSREQEEDENERTEAPREPDYEDTVKAKTIASGATTEETAIAQQSTTTEPPLQLVQDLIDALAGGGLNAILGTPRPPASVEEADKRLGDLKKYLHKPMEQKQKCASGHMRFMATELTDLTTRFEADAVVYSLQHCAKICYETGCTLAAFTRFPRPVCLMRYDNETNCHSDGTPTTSWNFTNIQQVVKLDCIKCDKHGEIIKSKETIDITNLNFSEDDENTVVPLHEGVTSKCEGRLEFQTLPVGSLPPLNVTNDIPARTPADCAKKCFESKGCSLAGFISSPSGNISHGVCLLTSDVTVCGNNADYVPQHAALNPFVVSCIKCSSCTYNIRNVTPDRVLPDFTNVESVSSIGECARACHARQCTMAQYNSQQHLCMTTTEPQDSKCARETAVVTEGVLPVTLECVSCST